jgi:glycosyltransferase involved in cell wall biosynthesis
VISGWSFPPHQSEDRRFESRAWAKHHRVAFGALALPHRRFWQRLRQRFARALVRLGVRCPLVVIRAWHPAGPDLIRAARGVCADLYVAHYSAALPAAALAARTHAGRYAFDAEDFHLGDFSEGPAYEPQRQLLRCIESRYLRGCAYVTAASPGIAIAYSETYGIPLPVVVRNVFPLAHAPEGPTPRGTAIPGPSIYWFSQTIGPDRGLECAVRAIALATSKPHLYLRGFIRDEYRGRLEALAQAEGVEDRLHLLPHASPENMVTLAAAFDLGLVGETGRTPNHRIALANKLFVYALAGVPAVISDIPAHRLYVQQAGETVKLFNVEDSHSMASAIDIFLLDQLALEASRVSAFALGREVLNWDQECSVFLRAVASALHQL